MALYCRPVYRPFTQPGEQFMKKITLSLLFALTLSLIALAAFASGIGRVSAAGSTQQFGPYPSTSPDSGTCGNDWATDTFDRQFKVSTRPNADGTYTVNEEFKNGSFVTMAGPSPGACQTNPGG